MESRVIYANTRIRLNVNMIHLFYMNSKNSIPVRTEQKDKENVCWVIAVYVMCVCFYFNFCCHLQFRLGRFNGQANPRASVLSMCVRVYVCECVYACVRVCFVTVLLLCLIEFLALTL